jgi:predicted nucleic acid-binding Zn ribbon protein
MRVFDRTCPVCQKAFEAKRRNQVYCSPECRADLNNDKLKAKFQSIKTLEQQKHTGDQYRMAFLSAVRIVQIDYDYDQKNETILFEGKKFEKISLDTDVLKSMGVELNSNAIQEGKRVAVYIPQQGLLCFLRYDSYATNGVTYRLIPKKK